MNLALMQYNQVFAYYSFSAGTRSAVCRRAVHAIQLEVARLRPISCAIGQMLLAKA